MLLAHLPEGELKELTDGPLARFTSLTITDPSRLARGLAQIRRQGWAFDRGEFAPSINAYAAPVPDRSGRVIAALSVPFLAGADRARRERIRAAVIAAAGAVAADIPAASHKRASGQKDRHATSG
jgi:DNA-binding IclR family transcriptional regulator